MHFACSDRFLMCAGRFQPRWHLRTLENHYLFRLVSEKFAQCCFSNSSSAGLTTSSLSSPVRRDHAAGAMPSFHPLPFHAFLLQAIHYKMFLALCSRTLEPDLPRRRAFVVIASPYSYSVSSRGSRSSRTTDPRMSVHDGCRT